MAKGLMTKYQEELIEKNMQAYVTNFGYIGITRSADKKGFLVYKSPVDELTENYIQYCPNIHYLNGWLYGAVQGALILKSKLQDYTFFSKEGGTCTIQAESYEEAKVKYQEACEVIPEED